MRHESDPNGRWILRALAGFAAISLSSCAEPLLGTMTSYGGEIGDWNVTANSCYSSARQAAVGSVSLFTFARRSGPFPLIQLNVGSVSGRPELVTVQTSDPPREIQLHAEDCTRFDIQQHRNTDGSIRADAELECATGDGWRFIASLHAESCRGRE